MEGQVQCVCDVLFGHVLKYIVLLKVLSVILRNSIILVSLCLFLFLYLWRAEYILLAICYCYAYNGNDFLELFLTVLTY